MAENKGAIPRPQVGVGIIVMRRKNGKQQILMHRRGQATSSGHGYWGTGGGHLELGESIMEAAIRELREEAGDKLKIKNVRFIGVCNFTELMPKHYVDISFMADWVSGEPEVIEKEKATKWQWFDIDKLPTPVYPIVARYLKAYKTGEVFLDSKAS